MKTPPLRTKLEELTLIEIGRRLDSIEARLKAIEGSQLTPTAEQQMALLIARLDAYFAMHSGRPSK
jgi:hypothetical protein